MDYLSRHLAGLPRRLNVAPQLDSIGFIPEKRDIVDRIFPSWNFSFVLAGEGFYELGGVRHKVRAPAVLTQWPGEPMHYGPDSAWREIFLIYPENCGEKLRELGLMRENRPFWQVGNPHRLFELAEEFETLAADAELESNTDRLDCCAVRLVLESLLEKQLGVPGRLEPELRALAGQIRRNPSRPYDWDEEAAKLGISRTTFRRFFLAYLNLPAGEFLLNARIDRARRLLIETTLPVAEIARRFGFADPFYFSRRFRLENGETASAYRDRNRVGG